VVRKIKVLLYERTQVGKTAEKMSRYGMSKRFNTAWRCKQVTADPESRLEIDVQGIDNPMIRKEA